MPALTFAGWNIQHTEHLIAGQNTQHIFISSRLLKASVDLLLPQVKAPFPPVGSFQLKISQFLVSFLYFFHSANLPATPPILTIPPARPSPSIPALPTPTCLMELQHTLKKCTIRKKIKYPVHYIYSVLHKQPWSSLVKYCQMSIKVIPFRPILMKMKNNPIIWHPKYLY